MAVSLNPEILGYVSGFTITNTFTSIIITDTVIIGLCYALRKKIAVIPGKLQNIVESVLDYLYSLIEQVSGPGKIAEAVFPWFASFFLFIVISNLLALLPGYFTIFENVHGGEEHFPLLRAGMSDLNVTLPLAVISVVATQVMSIKFIGIKHYLMRFFSINPIFLFVGLLEIVSELTRIVSLSFRLFGNIYSGEFVLSLLLTLFPFFGPLPFLLLELIKAIVQALVFSMLTMVFMSLAMKPHTESNEGGEHS